jgi:hypothetical protein
MAIGPRNTARAPFPRTSSHGRGIDTSGVVKLREACDARWWSFMVRIGFADGQLEFHIQIHFVVKDCDSVIYNRIVESNPEKGDFAYSNVCCRE